MGKKLKRNGDVNSIKQFILQNREISIRELAVGMSLNRKGINAIPYHRLRTALALGIKRGLFKKVEKDDRTLIVLNKPLKAGFSFTLWRKGRMFVSGGFI